MSGIENDGANPPSESHPEPGGGEADAGAARLVDALDRAEKALGSGDVPAARAVLTGLEARLMVAGLGSHLPRFFRLAADCEHRQGNLEEAVRLCTKGLTRLQPADTDERRRLVDLGRRILQEAESNQA